MQSGDGVLLQGFKLEEFYTKRVSWIFDRGALFVQPKQSS